MADTADEYTELLDKLAAAATLAANGHAVLSVQIVENDGPGHFSLEIPTHRVDAMVKYVIDGVTNEIGERGLAGLVAANMMDLVKDPSAMN